MKRNFQYSKYFARFLDRIYDWLWRPLEFYALTYDITSFLPYATLLPHVQSRGIYLGRDEVHRQVYINFNRLPSGSGVILGPIGYGKSTLARTIALRCLNANPRIIPISLDPTGEYAVWASRCGIKVLDMFTYTINPFDTLGIVEPKLVIKRTTDFLENIFDLWDEQTSNLYHTALKLSEERGYDEYGRARFTLKDVLDELDRSHPLNRDLIAKLELTASHFSKPSTIDAKSLVMKREPVVVTYKSGRRRLDRDTSIFLSLSFIRQFWDVNEFLGYRHYVEHLIFLDEAYWLMKVGAQFLSEAVRQTRKLSIGFVIISHFKSDIPESILKNVSWIFATAGGEKYVDELSTLIGFHSELRDKLLFGEVGEGILALANYPRPVYLKVEPEELALVGEVKPLAT